MTQPQLESDGLRMFNFAQKTLNFVVEAAIENLVDLPSRQYTTSGSAVYDCEQVAVTAATLNTGFPGQGTPGIPASSDCYPIWSIVLEIAIVRCAPEISMQTGSISVQKMNETFRRSSMDANVLMDTITKLSAFEDVFTNLAASITTQGFNGQLVGTIARLTVGLP